jgi:hypothetical protein
MQARWTPIPGSILSTLMLARSVPEMLELRLASLLLLVSTTVVDMKMPDVLRLRGVNQTMKNGLMND